MEILQQSGPPARGRLTRLRIAFWLVVSAIAGSIILWRWASATAPATRPATVAPPAAPVTAGSLDWLAIITASWSAFLAALPWLAIAALVMWAWGRRGLVWRDKLGYLPALRQSVELLARMQTAGEAQARVEAARRPNVPHTVTYSPSLAYHQSSRAIEAPMALQAPVADQLANLPGPVGLLDALRVAPLPAGTILLGLDAGGRAVTLDPAVSPHLLAVGRSRSGKTFTSRGYLAQRLVAGAGAVVLDPHYNGPVWAPLEPYIIGQPATTPAAAVAALAWLVAEMEARLAVYRVEGDAGMARYRPLVAWIDEAPAMLADKRAAGHVTTLLRQAGKVGISCYLLSQDALTGTLNASSGVRVNLTASLVAGLVDDSTAKVALGAGHGVPLDQLGRGVAALRLDGYPAQLVRTPAAALDDLARLLASGPVDDGRVLAMEEGPAGHWSASISRGETRPGLVEGQRPPLTLIRPTGQASKGVAAGGDVGAISQGTTGLQGGVAPGSGGAFWPAQQPVGVATGAGVGHLSNRDQTIMDLIGAGLTDPQVGARLNGRYAGAGYQRDRDRAALLRAWLDQAACER